MNPKIIAFYLPQFHRIPENDMWWGAGFTEWTNVRKSKPNYKGHNQPEVPLNNNYYSLLDPDTQIWQSNLAQKYGVYGFCYYHYWFGGRLLLEKPMENMLTNKSITIPFCVCWANENWTRRWDGQEQEILIKQNYEDDDNTVIRHFNYLLPFFKDERYIKKENKPLFIIYRPHLIKNLKRIIDLWEEQAKNNGFDGILWGNQNSNYLDYKEDPFDFRIEFEPFYTRDHAFYHVESRKQLLLQLVKHPSNIIDYIYQKKTGFFTDEYEYLIKKAIKLKTGNKNFLGAFPAWDNTPRRGKNSYMVKGSTPELFKEYMKALLEKNDKKSNGEFIFINAWNEWAEGAHLEPDEKHGYAYLEALKFSLENHNK